MKFLYIFYLILMITPEIRTDNEVKIIAIHKDVSIIHMYYDYTLHANYITFHI